ncbi:hypothetical protein TrispH2_007644 [Trichoplax sp. H2]|nr:hypothetical protein TrispH2_007644 [Trichoplax sp. H2]|eukprot:RDD38823.1 hypothetical protein TrispH2_007644 [Trichoplax sp. H2]
MNKRRHFLSLQRSSTTNSEYQLRKTDKVYGDEKTILPNLLNSSTYFTPKAIEKINPKHEKAEDISKNCEIMPLHRTKFMWEYKACNSPFLSLNRYSSMAIISQHQITKEQLRNKKIITSLQNPSTYSWPSSEDIRLRVTPAKLLNREISFASNFGRRRLTKFPIELCDIAKDMYLGKGFNSKYLPEHKQLTPLQSIKSPRKTAIDDKSKSQRFGKRMYSRLPRKHYSKKNNAKDSETYIQPPIADNKEVRSVETVKMPLQSIVVSATLHLSTNSPIMEDSSIERNDVEGEDKNSENINMSPKSSQLENPLEPQISSPTINNEKLGSIINEFKSLDADLDGRLGFNDIIKILPRSLSSKQRNFLKKIHWISDNTTFFGVAEYYTFKCLCDCLAAMSPMAKQCYENLDYCEVEDKENYAALIKIYEDLDNGSGRVAIITLERCLITERKLKVSIQAAVEKLGLFYAIVSNAILIISDLKITITCRFCP